MSTNRQIFLKGKNIDLVILKPSDASLILTWFRDPEVNLYLSGGCYPITIEHEKKYIAGLYKNKNNLLLGIYHPKDKKLIGTASINRINEIHLHGSFGIAIGDKKYWGKSYGTQTLKAMLHWSFNVRGLRLITLYVLGHNLRAQNCYKKCGFTTVGIIPESEFKQGEWVDKHLMMIKNPLLK